MDSRQVRLFRPSDVLFICVGDFFFPALGRFGCVFLGACGLFAAAGACVAICLVRTPIGSSGWCAVACLLLFHLLSFCFFLFAAEWCGCGA